MKKLLIFLLLISSYASALDVDMDVILFEPITDENRQESIVDENQLVQDVNALIETIMPDFNNEFDLNAYIMQINLPCQNNLQHRCITVDGQQIDYDDCVQMVTLMNVEAGFAPALGDPESPQNICVKGKKGIQDHNFVLIARQNFFLKNQVAELSGKTNEALSESVKNLTGQVTGLYSISTKQKQDEEDSRTTIILGVLAAAGIFLYTYYTKRHGGKELVPDIVLNKKEVPIINAD